MKMILQLFLLCPLLVFGQNKIQDIVDHEYEKGHFSGTVLYADQMQFVTINKGMANIQFDVKINDKTRFPIASVTKLFTSLAVLQLFENGSLSFEDTIDKYITDLHEDCRKITIKQLIIHRSNLVNEPIKAVMKKYSIDDYIRDFTKRSVQDTLKFNYNNVDFVLLSKVIEKVTQKSFLEAINDLILQPLKMENTGFVKEEIITKNLAYGYHNNTFGDGDKNEPLYNDRRYLSNYYGAGAMYSNTADLYKLLTALKKNTLISEKTKRLFLTKPQMDDYIDWLSGKPTMGFYYDTKEKESVLRRSGNIDGFNASIIVNENFNKVLIILCNTDTADLNSLANKIYFAE
ncbi:serine hydrolase domain-containing protein [Sphingobacterium kitahiroshimense]|uniref:Serine hydrolase domain-containing protein n=1 Tax=Sphingobacterium kitahiroshimense TaxID=470446 RepID=A0ABV0BPH3_9SPHI